MNDLHRIYQTTRRELPTPLDWFTCSHVIVLPDRWMAHFGGAAVVYGIVFVGQGVGYAAPHIQKALLAHERGHIVCGHAIVPLLNLFLLSFYISAKSPMASLFFLGLLALTVFWLIRPAREFEADQAALRITTRDDLRDALAWSVERYCNGVAPPRVAERIHQLKGIQA